MNKKKYIDNKMEYINTKKYDINEIIKKSDKIKNSFYDSAYYLKSKNINNNYDLSNLYDDYDKFINQLFNDKQNKIKNDNVTLISMSTGKAPLETYLCSLLKKEYPNIYITLVVIENENIDEDTFYKYIDIYDELLKFNLVDRYFTINDYDNLIKYNYEKNDLTSFHFDYSENYKVSSLQKKFDKFIDDIKLGDVIICGSSIIYDNYNDENDKLFNIFALFQNNKHENFEELDKTIKKYNIIKSKRLNIIDNIINILNYIKYKGTGNIYIKFFQKTGDKLSQQKISNINDIKEFKKLFEIYLPYVSGNKFYENKLNDIIKIYNNSQKLK